MTLRNQISERLAAWRLGVSLEWLQDRRKQTAYWLREMETRPDVSGLTVEEATAQLKAGTIALYDVFELAHQGDQYIFGPRVLKLLGVASEAKAIPEIQRQNRRLEALADLIKSKGSL